MSSIIRATCGILPKEKHAKTDIQYIKPFYNMMKIEGFEEKGLGLLLTMPFTVQKQGLYQRVACRRVGRQILR